MTRTHCKTGQFQSNQSARNAHRALRNSLRIVDQAQGHAVLWYADIKQRRLYRHLGFPSMNMYARSALGFSDTKASDFSRLADKLDGLPAIRRALQDGSFGYTKARMIITVCDPANEELWVQAARENNRQRLDILIKAARQKARDARAGQPELAAAAPAVDNPATPRSSTPEPQPRHSNLQPRTRPGLRAPTGEHPAPMLPLGSPADPTSATPAAMVPVRLTCEFSPEQFAQFEALLEMARKAGHNLPSSRGDLLLELLGHFLATIKTKRSKNFPRGKAPHAQPFADESPGNEPEPNIPPPFQIHLHHCPACSRSTVQTSRGELAVMADTYERALCDAQIDRPHDQPGDRPGDGSDGDGFDARPGVGSEVRHARNLEQRPDKKSGDRNSATIPPRTRRRVLSRDRHRCRRPGCGNTHFLEIHHLVPRSRGGGNEPENLVTLCSACHRLLHERRWATDSLIREVHPPYQFATPEALGSTPVTGPGRSESFSTPLPVSYPEGTLGSRPSRA